MPTEKAAIAEALQTLDHTKDDLWTDDGSPLVSEIQRLCNDPKITRAQINEALPGFARKGTDSVTEPVDDETDPPEAKVTVTEPTAKNTTIVAPPEDEILSDADDYERLRLIAKGRVTDAEIAVTEAKAKISDAQLGLRAAEGRLTRALTLYSARYPAISVAANIKQHLERQQEILRERITGSKFEPNAAQNPVDATLMDRKRDNGRNGRSTQAPAAFLPRKAAVNY